MRIVFTGGGTGGHIFPISAVAREFKKKPTLEKSEMVYIGPNGFTKDILKKEGIKTRIILAGKIRRYFSFENVLDILKILIGLIQSYFHLFWIMPDIIFSKGGYGSFPIVLVGWFFRIPIIVHESDSVPGLVNRILGRLANRIFLSFDTKEVYFPGQKSVLVGNPIRYELLEGNADKARQQFSLSGGRPIVLIIGGSQGAKRINDTILEILPKLVSRYELIHQCGIKNFDELAKESKVLLEESQKKFYHLFPFLDEKQLAHAYKVSNLIISRAGSGSLFEIATLGKPSIIIPLSTAASDHQRKNAYEYSQKTKAEVLEEPNLTPHLFLEKIDSILENSELQKEMAERAGKFAKPDAAKLIVDEILKATR